jgi:L-threonylcarbamoyladenylate synthase
MTKIALSNNAPLIVSATIKNIEDAAYMLHKGEVVAFPTETVYGLGGCVDNAQAIANIYAMKGRPAHNPLIVHVTDAAMAARYGIITQSAEKLMQHFFPAPLTVVVPVRAGSVAEAVLAGGESVALRSPMHPVARRLLEVVGEGIAAPSANRSGRISPTCAAHVASEFAGHPLTIVDGGECAIGLESTVVDCRGERLRILRHGAVTQEEIAAVVGDALEENLNVGEGGILLSPGQLASHYAPHCAVRLNAAYIDAGEVALNFGNSGLHSDIATLNLSKDARLEEAAHHLYDYLRLLDKKVADIPEARGIAVAAIPNKGVGVAINDRLQRAAAEK